MIDDTGKNRDSDSSTPESESPKPTGEYHLKDYLKDEIDDLHKADNAARNEPNLRKEMVIIVDELDKMLEDHAHNLALITHEETGAFVTDIAKDLIVWQLAEYLIRGYLERNPIEPPITRGWQVTEAHGMDFFHVSKYGDGSYVALEVEADRS